jgi:restriction system protein
MGRALGRSNDGGVDGVIKEDELGLDVVYIQAKRYSPSNTIGRPVLQNFAGSLEGFNATKGVFVTTSSFLDTAYEYVQKIHKRIILIDGKELANLMIRHNVGVRTKDVYEVKKVDEDYFVE